MITIFAKYGTNTKIAVDVHSSKIRLIQVALNKKLGGEWLRVEDLKNGEIIQFDDGMVYKGFNPEIERYSDAIIDLNKKDEKKH